MEFFPKLNCYISNNYRFSRRKTYPEIGRELGNEFLKKINVKLFEFREGKLKKLRNVFEIRSSRNYALFARECRKLARGKRKRKIVYSFILFW